MWVYGIDNVDGIVRVKQAVKIHDQNDSTDRKLSKYTSEEWS